MRRFTDLAIDLADESELFPIEPVHALTVPEFTVTAATAAARAVDTSTINSTNVVLGGYTGYTASIAAAIDIALAHVALSPQGAAAPLHRAGATLHNVVVVLPLALQWTSG